MFLRRRNQRNKLQFRSRKTSQFGFCICPQCNYSVTHKRGVPCASLICPNCNIPLVRQERSENKNQNTTTKRDTTSSNFPQIDLELCVGCGACVKVCPANAIVLEDGKARIINEKCKNCRACVEVCKKNAIH